MDVSNFFSSKKDFFFVLAGAVQRIIVTNTGKNCCVQQKPSRNEMRERAPWDEIDCDASNNSFGFQIQHFSSHSIKSFPESFL